MIVADVKGLDKCESAVAYIKCAKEVSMSNHRINAVKMKNLWLKFKTVPNFYS